MDQVKIEAAQAKVRTQGARTASSPEKIEQAVAAVASMAALVEGGSQIEHTNDLSHIQGVTDVAH